MTHRDDIPRLLARSVRRGDAVHREACGTLSNGLGMPPFRSSLWPAGGRQKRLPMPHIAGTFLPARRTAWTIYMGHYHCSLE